MAQFDPELLKTNIVTSEIKQIASLWKLSIESIYFNNDNQKLNDLLLIVNCIDLTTLSGDDTETNVHKLCYRAINPLCKKILIKLNEKFFINNHNNGNDEFIDNNYNNSNNNNITTGAVCVYPSRVNDCCHYFNIIDKDKTNIKISIASVVAGFPTGQSPLSVTINDIDYAIKCGANEIDIVIDRSLVIAGKWQKLYDEIAIIAKHCHIQCVHLKVILSCGELGNLDNVYKASMCAMMAGADFIKTSTGKETINATLSYGLIMIRAINDFYMARQIRVGIKPAGGIKNSMDALCWLNLVRFYLGNEWINNQLFRIGASSLLNDIEYRIYRLLFKCIPKAIDLSMT